MKRFLLLLILLLPLLVSTLIAQTPRRQQQVSRQASLRTGRYVGRAWNTTSALAVEGKVIFEVTDFDKPTGQIKADMYFSEGLCGSGSFSGIADDEGLSLSGELSSSDETCGDQSWSMITRCKFSQDGTLTCSYRLTQESGRNQKGTFEITRTVPPSPKSVRRFDFPKEDLGVDLGVVITEKANLRDGPSTSNTVVMEVDQGDYLVLVDRNPVGPWYNVVHVESSKEGWINGNAIEIKFTQNRKSGPLLEERSGGSNQNPYIEVTNDSDRMLYLKVGDGHYTIKPHDKQTIHLTPGTYKYYASSPGIIPTFGEDYLKDGHWYTWQFYIVHVVK